MLISQPVFAQATPPLFDAEFEVTKSLSSDQAQVTLHTRVAHSGLSFLSLPAGFTAAYDLTVEVREADDKGHPGDLVFTRLISRQVSPLPDFSQTLADTLFHLTRQPLGALQPGNYLVTLRAEDTNTLLASSLDVPLQILSFDAPVSMSTALLLEHQGSGSSRLSPNVANVFNIEDQQFSVSFEVYADASRSARYAYKIYRLKGHGRKMRREEIPEREMAPVEERMLYRGTNRALASIPLNDLKLGNYVIEVSVEDPDGNILSNTYKPFEIRWMGLNEQVSELDVAIAQLEPIAKSRQLRAMQEAETRQEKWALFSEFWAKRDPTPRTERNERMEMFYYRAWFADDRFTTVAENGWQSDRGKVFMRFGEPDQTMTYPLNAIENFEVWTYKSINRRFIFIEREGNGRYELLRPIWDKRNRIR